MSSSPSKILEVFDNPNVERDFVIRIDSSEFTCLCPLTGQPDFADIHIEYIADKYCVELKALKNYFWSYRNEGAFHEAVTNKMLDDLVDAMVCGVVACLPADRRISLPMDEVEIDEEGFRMEITCPALTVSF